MEQLIAQLAQAMAQGQGGAQMPPPASNQRAHQLERQVRRNQDVLANPNAGMPEIAMARDGHEDMMAEWGALIDGGATFETPPRVPPSDDELMQMEGGATNVPMDPASAQRMMQQQHGDRFQYSAPIDPTGDEYFKNELGQDYETYMQMTPDQRLQYLNDPANGFVPPLY